MSLVKRTMTIPLNVLIVEDDENDAILLMLKLREGGYEPWLERVQTPEALRAALARKSWDVVISDHNMPRFSAPEALKVVREAGLDIPFIIISGKINENMAVEAMKVGAHDYLSKDNLTRLIPVIEREMREALYRRERRQNAEALREHDAVFRTVVNAAADAIVLVDDYIPPSACLATAPVK
jgi:DNA-binding NtrC family response regulator